MMQDTNEMEYVGFWPRFGAAMVDGILEFIVAYPFLMHFYGKAYWTNKALIKGPADFVISYLFPAVATILFWVFKQATPGKMMLSAKIVDARTGKKPTPGQFIGRYFAYILSVLPLGLGFIWIASDSKKQGWHDKLAGTVVIRPKKHTDDVTFEAR